MPVGDAQLLRRLQRRGLLRVGGLSGRNLSRAGCGDGRCAARLVDERRVDPLGAMWCRRRMRGAELLLRSLVRRWCSGAGYARLHTPAPGLRPVVERVRGRRRLLHPHLSGSGLLTGLHRHLQLPWRQCRPADPMRIPVSESAPKVHNMMTTRSARFGAILFVYGCGSSAASPKPNEGDGTTDNSSCASGANQCDSGADSPSGSEGEADSDTTIDADGGAAEVDATGEQDDATF